MRVRRVRVYACTCVRAKVCVHALCACMRGVRAVACMCASISAALSRATAVSTRERLLVDRNDELEDRLRDYENMQACALCIPTMQMRSGVHATDDTHELRDCSRV